MILIALISVRTGTHTAHVHIGDAAAKCVCKSGAPARALNTRACRPRTCHVLPQCCKGLLPRLAGALPFASRMLRIRTCTYAHIDIPVSRVAVHVS